MELAYQEPSSENSFKYLLYFSVKRGLSLVQIKALKATVNISSSEFIGRCIPIKLRSVTELVITGAAVYWHNPWREMYKLSKVNIQQRVTCHLDSSAVFHERGHKAER